MSDPNALAQIADLEISISDRSLLNFGNDEESPIASAVPVNKTPSTNNNTSAASLAMAMDQFESGTSPPQSPRLSAAELQQSRSSCGAELQQGRAARCQANNSGGTNEDPERRGSTTSNISKDSARSSVSFQLEPVVASSNRNNHRSAPNHSSAIASAVAMDNLPVATERNTFDYRLSATDNDYDADDAAANSYYPQSIIPATKTKNSNYKMSGKKKKKKGVLKNNNSKANPSSNNNNSRALTMVSAQYDFENKGYLDPTQQAMRARDTSNKGHLDHSKVYQIVQEQLSTHSLMNTYKKIIVGLLCLVMILALSNFGTSWAAAILTKDTVAQSETNTITSKETGEVVGFQNVGYTYELDILTEEEFEQRRKLVDDAIASNPDHEDHAHRRLGKNKNKNQNNKCNCSKIAYDRNKLSERDLQSVTRRCDGINTVNVVRRFRDRDGTPTGVDYDQICGPGTVVVIKKGKKKRNKKGDKTKVVNERVTFRQKKKRDGRMKDLHFECAGGSCFTSGEHLHQRAGHPCNPDRDRTDASECIEGLFCHDPDGYGSGVCTRPELYAPEDQACNMAFGVDACESGYSCKCSGTKEDCKKYKDEPNFIDLRIGYCARVNERVKDRDICDARHGNKACDDGYMCLGSNGEELRDRGLGICTRLAKQQRQYDVCDLSYGGDSCQREYYCQDRNRGRNFGGNNNNGAGNNNGLGVMHQGATISGPSGSTSTGNLGYNRSNRGKDYVARTVGTGVCVRSTGLGRSCGTHEECGHGYSCIGLGNGNNANAGTGGSISGPSGSISWGNNGAAASSRSGFCG